MQTKSRNKFDLVGSLGRGLLISGMIFTLASCGSPPSNTSQADAAWLARMGNWVVTVQEFQNYFEQQCRRNPKLPTTPSEKKKLLRTYLEKVVLVQEATRLGLDQDPKVQMELKEARQQILLKHLFNRRAAEFEKHISIGEDEVNRYYEDLCREIRVRYVLVEDPMTASKVMDSWDNNKIPIDAIDSGLVRLASLSEEWKKQIGNLPVMKPKLVKIGSELFVIQVVSKTMAPEKPLNEVRDRIIKELTDRKKQKMLQEWVTGLKTKKPIEINQTYTWR